MAQEIFSEFVMIKTKALPEVFIKTLKAKKLMEQGSAKTVQEALDATELSRSAFYKYRDCIYPASEGKGHTVTLGISLSDQRGLLSEILNIIAGHGANILTINQTIPINSVAYVTLTIQTAAMECMLSALIKELADIKGVAAIKILSGE